MGTDAWITLAVLVAMLVTLLRDRFPPAGVVLAANLVLLLVDVIDVEVAFAGFSNPAPITVGALFVLAAGVQRTGLLSVVIARLLGGSPGSRGNAARLLFPVMGLSAFVNNTPLVAMVIPEVVAWSRRTGQAASRLLLPLSYAAILGGTLTVVGTSTNLIVSGLLQDQGEAPLGMFSVAVVGLPVVVVGAAVLFVVSLPLMPHRTTAPQQVMAAQRDFQVEMRVASGSSLVGQSIRDAGLRDLEGVFLASLRRGEGVLAPVAPNEVLVDGDELIFVGEVANVLDLQRIAGLEPLAAKEVDRLVGGGRGTYEAVIGRTSPIVGKTLKEADFRARYGAAVLAIHRAGQPIEGKLGEVVLRNGDTLLVVAPPAFRRRYASSRDFLVVAEIEAELPVASKRAPLVGLVAAGFVLAVTFGLLSTVEAALLAGAAMVVGRVMTFTEARDSVDLDVVLMIAAAFGVGGAVEQSGLAAAIADGFIGGLGGFGTFGLILGIVLATSILTEVVTNNAAAVSYTHLTLPTTSRV